MKFIIEANKQIITPRGRKFYHPFREQWIDDYLLVRYSPDMLASRHGIFKFKEEPYDRTFYRQVGYTDAKDGNTITRTYELEQKLDIIEFGKRKLAKYKQEGIRAYLKVLDVGRVLEFTGDTIDINAYAQSLRDTFVAARNELTAIATGTGDDKQKYDQLVAHDIVWPDVPEELEDYINA